MLKVYEVPFSFGDEVYNIKIEYERKKRKTMVLKVNPDTVTVKLSMPVYTSQEYAREFLLKNEEWLKKTLYKALFQMKKHNYLHGDTFFYLGKELFLNIIKSDKNSISICEDEIVLCETKDADLAKRKDIIEKHLYEAFIPVAKESLLRMLRVYENYFNINFVPELSLRKMKSKWGICRPYAKKITLSKRLAHVSLELIDYVVAHELCHFAYIGHDRNFWQLVEKGVPDWREKRKLLNGLDSYTINV